MKEILLLVIAMVIGVTMTEQSNLTKEQLKIIAIYCKAMPECREEMDKGVE